MTEADFRDALTKCGGDPRTTALYLGVTVRTIYRYMKRYGIKRRMIVA